MKIIILIIYLIIYYVQDNFIVIPDEIVYPTEILQEKSHISYNQDLYDYELNKQKISLYDDTISHNGRIYYKSPKAYYGPTETYKDIPRNIDIKFETPITIENLEEYQDEESLRKELLESENQLSNLILFTNEPKNINNMTIKDNYALPYYDSSYEDKLIRVNEIRKRILEIRHHLKINDQDVRLFVQVQNNTFPQHANDILEHLHESYYHIEENVNSTDIFDNNGNIKVFEETSKISDNHLKNPTNSEHLSDIKKNINTNKVVNTINSTTLKYHLPTIINKNSIEKTPIVNSIVTINNTHITTPKVQTVQIRNTIVKDNKAHFSMKPKIDSTELSNKSKMNNKNDNSADDDDINNLL